MTFEPTYTDALRRLSEFIPKAGRDYASKRNYDYGPNRHQFVSTLSPYTRHRVITERDVLQAVLARHSPSSAEKFIQEVYWRTYWKGWLERRPSVWRSYQAELKRALDDVHSQAGLRRAWEDACNGETGIDCFDAWAKELVTEGYLHNHTRMWFASIWIFTLELPWVLGADFFMRHLLDGDPASNTLGWRWVAGLQTRGKTYLARADNISKYTEGRFRPVHQLAFQAIPLDGPENPPAMEAPIGDVFDPQIPTLFLLHEEDLSPSWLFDRGLSPLATATLSSPSPSPLHRADAVRAFKTALMQDCTGRWSARLGPLHSVTTSQEIAALANSVGAGQIVTAYPPVGPVADVVQQVTGIPVRQILRNYDATAWPHAKAGFFKFKDKIPKLLDEIKPMRAA